MTFVLTYIDESIEQVAADAYVSEGPLTTFFRVAPGRAPRLDHWSTRCMSVRTERIAAVRLLEDCSSAGLSLVG